MKQLITEILTQFQRGELTLEQATDRLLIQKMKARARKASSDRRLKSLCGALQRERSEAKVRQIKSRLRHEFYYGDQAP
jgi:hypothetical protein